MTIGSHFGITHIDKGALQWAANTLDCRSMLDIGCGPGDQIMMAHGLGYIARGIDGDPACHSDHVTTHDFTKHAFIPDRQYDLAWSCEFVEHVPDEHTNNFMPCFAACRWVILTHSLVSAEGHPNAQPSLYWVSLFNVWNFDLIWPLTLEMRKASTMTREFIQETGLVFQRRN